MGSSTEFKYQHIYRDLKSALTDGRIQPGERLPTENELVQRYGVSRPTATKALNSLQQEGLVDRKIGSGTYATTHQPNRAPSHLFGLLVPGLGKGEIFEPICNQIALLAEERDFALLWSGGEIKSEQTAEGLVAAARRYVQTGAAGVFFAPLELSPSFESINRKVIGVFEAARVPIVLIDSDYVAFPERSHFDLVGMDNFQGGYVVTQYMLKNGAERVDFLARPYSAYTVPIRLRGYKEALVDCGIMPHTDWVHFGDPEDAAFVEEHLLKSGASHVVCANDATAAALMNTLDAAGVGIPNQMAIVGFDDVGYAPHLRVPLTTLHQPCSEIADMAVETMLWRIKNPTAPARTHTVVGRMVVRRSCGARGAGAVTNTPAEGQRART